jgi:hypothetical protein
MTTEERHPVPPLFMVNRPQEGVGENSGAQFPVHPHPHDFPFGSSRSEIFLFIGDLLMWIEFGWAHWRCRIGKINLKHGAKLVCAETCGNYF